MLLVSSFAANAIGAQGTRALIIKSTAATANGAPVHHNPYSHHSYDQGKNEEDYQVSHKLLICVKL